METGHRGNRSPSDTIDISRPLIVRVLSPPFPVPSLVRILMSLSPLLVSMLAVSVVGVAPITISLLVAMTTNPLHLAMTPVVATVTASVSIPAYFPVVHLIFSFLQIITSHRSHPHTAHTLTPSLGSPVGHSLCGRGREGRGSPQLANHSLLPTTQWDSSPGDKPWGCGFAAGREKGCGSRWIHQLNPPLPLPPPASGWDSGLI